MVTIPEVNTANNARSATLIVGTPPASLVPPQGWYESGQVPGSSSSNSRLTNMANGGATLVISYWIYSDGVYSSTSDANVIAHLDACAARGMKAIINMGNPNWFNGTIPASTTTQKVNLVKNHPALFGYSVTDEASGTTASNQCKAHAQNIRNADGNLAHEIIGVHYPQQFPGAWSFYEGSAITVVGIDHYPYGQYSTDTAARSAITSFLNTTVQGAKDRGKKYLYIPQANNVPVSYPSLSASWPYPQLPTVAQMTFQRNEGIRICAQLGVPLVGMLWYSYYDNLDDYPSHVADVEAAINAPYP